MARRVAVQPAPDHRATTVNARRPATSPWRATARWNATRCAIVHEEIDRLSDTQRLPILLCALEGLSHEEAAQQLRWPVGTVKSRLVRGRRRLQGRLARRGLAADIADTPAWAAPVPLALAMATTRAALQSVVGMTAAAAPAAASPAGSVAFLLQSELRALLLAKVTLVGGAVFAACAAGIVIGIMLAGQPARRRSGGGNAPQYRKVRPPAGEGAEGHPGTELTGCTQDRSRHSSDFVGDCRYRERQTRS